MRKTPTPENPHTLLKQLRDELENRRRQRELKASSPYASTSQPLPPQLDSASYATPPTMTAGPHSAEHLLHAYHALSEVDKQRVLSEILTD